MVTDKTLYNMFTDEYLAKFAGEFALRKDPDVFVFESGKGYREAKLLMAKPGQLQKLHHIFNLHYLF